MDNSYPQASLLQKWFHIKPIVSALISHHLVDHIYFWEITYLFKKYLRSYVCLAPGLSSWALCFPPHGSLVYSVSGSCHPWNKVKGSIPLKVTFVSQVSGSITCCLNWDSTNTEKLVILCANYTSSCTWAFPLPLFYPTGYLFIWLVPIYTSRLRSSTDSCGSHPWTACHQAFHAVNTSSKAFLRYFEIVWFHFCSEPSPPGSGLQTHKSHVLIICVCPFP